MLWVTFEGVKRWEISAIWFIKWISRFGSDDFTDEGVVIGKSETIANIQQKLRSEGEEMKFDGGCYERKALKTVAMN